MNKLSRVFKQMFEEHNKMLQEFLGERNVAQEFAKVGKEFSRNNVGNIGEFFKSIVNKVVEMVGQEEVFAGTHEFFESGKEFRSVKFVEGGESAQNLVESNFEFSGEEVGELVEAFEEFFKEANKRFREGLFENFGNTFKELNKFNGEEILDVVLSNDIAMGLFLDAVGSNLKYRHFE